MELIGLSRLLRTRERALYISKRLSFPSFKAFGNKGCQLVMVKRPLEFSVVLFAGQIHLVLLLIPLHGYLIADCRACSNNLAFLPLHLAHYIPQLPSKRLSCLPRLRLPTDRVPKLLPTNRMHNPPLFTSSQHDTKFVAIRSDVVIAAISQTNDRASDQITHPEALLNLYLVLLCSPNIFASDLREEGFATYGVVDDEDFAAGEAWAEARYADQDCAGDGWEEGHAAARVGTENTGVGGGGRTRY